MTKEHTPELWKYKESEARPGMWYVYSDIYGPLAEFGSEEDARRTVACVNGVSSISLQILEERHQGIGVLQWLIGSVIMYFDEDSEFSKEDSERNIRIALTKLNG